MQLNNVFREWLHRRKITDSVIEEFSLTGESEIIIPVLDKKGHFYFNKYRRSPLKDSGPKYWYDKGGTLALYAASKITPERDVVATEGEMDCLVCWSHNIQAVSSTGGAMAFEDEWLIDLKRTKNRLIVCFDNDSAGGEGMARIWDADKSAAFVFLPDRPGVKDISDYVSGGGDLAELLKTAKEFPDEESVRSDRAERTALWKGTFFHDAALKRLDEKRSSDRKGPEATRARSVNGDKVARAKQYPIAELVAFSQGKAKCLWHSEATGSMHYFKDDERVFCFGCGKGGDAIDVYRQINSCSFKEAVEALQ